MTYEKVREVCQGYTHVITQRGTEHKPFRGAGCRLCHVKWMLEEMLTWPPERLDKMFRWLGFVQGVLWCEMVYTIDEMKSHNMTGDVQ